MYQILEIDGKYRILNTETGLKEGTYFSSYFRVSQAVTELNELNASCLWEEALKLDRR